MSKPAIYITKGGLAQLWGISVGRVSAIVAEAAPNAYRDEGVDLTAMLEHRPTVLSERRFETIISKYAFALVDGQRADALEAVRADVLWALYSVVTERSNPYAPRDKAVREAKVDDRHDQLARLRMEKLRSEINNRNLKTQRESGALVARAEVERDLKAAGSVVQSTLSMLPSRVAELVPAESRAEATRRVEDAIERALYAIISALGGGGEEN